VIKATLLSFVLLAATVGCSDPAASFHIHKKADTLVIKGDPSFQGVGIEYAALASYSPAGERSVLWKGWNKAKAKTPEFRLNLRSYTYQQDYSYFVESDGFPHEQEVTKYMRSAH
jgi:hypothetical protein